MALLMGRWSIWLFEILAVPFLAGLVSVVYFMASPKSQPMRKRLMASAHGAVIVMLYALAWLVIIVGVSRPSMFLPFAILLLFPGVLIATSFFVYKGPRAVHWLQVPNVACLLWTGFAGGMLITGQSP
jgi:hypothetical protein